MKIICIGRNYIAHAKELNNETPETPVVFLKPSTALLKDNRPFYHPEWSSDIHHEAEIVLKICKQGKYIHERFAHKYFNEVSLGIDFTARDLQNTLKSKGLPWEIAKAFDCSAVVGKFFPVEKFNLADMNFYLQLNGITAQKGNTSQMLFSPAKIIAYASQFFTLQAGDLIFTGTPEGVGKVKIGDVLEGYLENERVFSCKIK